MSVLAFPPGTLVPGNPPLTMSSREIATLTGKRHDNVLKDIRKMFFELGEGLLSFEETYLDAQGKEQPGFNLPKDYTLTLVSGYDVKVRHAIVRRWIELEGAGAQVRPTPTLTLTVGNASLSMTGVSQSTITDLVGVVMTGRGPWS